MAKGGANVSKEEPARFGELDQYLFGQSTHYEIYRKMGAHPGLEKGKKGVWFTVWAPNASSVSVVGTFNGWRPDSHPMKKVAEMGVYELFVPEALEGELYKYCIHTKDGRELYKADPYAFCS